MAFRVAKPRGETAKRTRLTNSQSGLAERTREADPRSEPALASLSLRSKGDTQRTHWRATRPVRSKRVAGSRPSRLRVTASRSSRDRPSPVKADRQATDGDRVRRPQDPQEPQELQGPGKLKSHKNSEYARKPKKNILVFECITMIRRTENRAAARVQENHRVQRRL